MASNVEDLSVEYEEDGQVVIKQLDKKILTKGAWATLIFKYQQWENSKNDYSAPRFTIRRYRKMNDEYRQQSKFNISSVDQAKQIIEALQAWIQDS